MMKSINTFQRGAVSLFVVVFSMLLITVVTLSFLRIMISDQNQATNNDLSQSAYDSSMAGVEDAKRALVRYLSVCRNQGPAACQLLASQLSTDECNRSVRIGDVIPSGDEQNGSVGNTGEVKIQQSLGGDDDRLEQAYTCVLINMQTDDYIGSVTSGSSQMIPLAGASSFDKVTIEWFSREDISGNTTGEVNLPNLSTSQPLHRQANWPGNRPSVLRTQFMQFGDSFTLDSFDSTTAAGESNVNTLFLYPTGTTQSNPANSGFPPAPLQYGFTARDIRADSPSTNPIADTAGSSPLPVVCVASLGSGGYACTVELTLPTPVGGGDRSAFLRLTPFYSATHYRVTLSQSGIPVQFDGVQPEIDSTGRANTLFRRVATRVELYDTQFPYPESAIHITGNFCKDFGVTDTQYLAASNPCTP